MENRFARLTTSGAFLAAGLMAIAGCRGSLELSPDDAATVLARHTLEAPNPAARGSHAVRTLYYGSGTDENRPEYRDSVTITTESVDASKLVSLGDRAESRNEYWGFTPEEFPINGRVWYPEGEGPFPLVLVVHGNHDMKDFSDPGYDYLGELLASRGFILASVDQNFVNGAIRGENDGRGWLLLKHLQAWAEFNEEEGPFRGKVDMGHIALMGHSRGGEAVAVAAAFNRLERYPDDASLTFDFGFDIKGIVAIAPVDGQYLPAGQRAPVHDVSYLVFHGSHDGDVTSFHGLRQYERVHLDPEGRNFKAAVYMYRANHGQWNTVWGAHDRGPRSGRILDLRYLVEPEAQREVAEIYVTSFLEYLLHDDARWLPLFRDHRVVGEWLPKTMYTTRFQDASFQPLAGFEEDIDVTSGTMEGVRLRGDGLLTWREDELKLRSRNRSSTSASQDNQGVWLAWGDTAAASETVDDDPPAVYSLELADTLVGRIGLSEASSLHLLLAPTDRIPGGRPAREDDTSGADDETEEREEPAGDEDDDDASDPTPSVDVTVEVEDAAGRTARVILSDYGPVRRPLETHILRRRDMEEERFARLWELVLQSYSIPLSDFVEATPGLEVTRLDAVRLVFDRAPAGEVVVDDIGFARLDPAFWSARVEVGPRNGSARAAHR